MKIQLLSFASRIFYGSQAKLIESASKFGIRNWATWKYYQLISTNFFWKNIRILRSRRGAGYWAWQPFIIKRALEKVSEGDVVVFCDSGLEFKRDISLLKGIISENDVTVFSAGNFVNSEYTKRDAFIIMGCDSDKYWNGPQVLGGFHIWKKNTNSIKVINEYLEYCTNYQIVSDSKDRFGSTFSNYVAHRHPQSILSLLAIKHNLTVYRCPLLSASEFYSQEFKFDKSEITDFEFEDQLLMAHRTREYRLIDRLLYKLGLWF